MHAVGHRPGHPEHPRVDRRDIDRRIRHVDRSRRPRGGQEGQVPERSLVGEPLTSEGLEDRPQRLDVLPQARPGVLELAPVPPLHVGPHLGAEPQPEATPGHLGQLPRHRCGDHRAPGKGDGDAGEEVEIGREGGCRARQVGGATGLGHHQAGHTCGGCVPGEVLHPLQRQTSRHEVELHQRPTPPRSEAPRATASLRALASSDAFSCRNSWPSKRRPSSSDPRKPWTTACLAANTAGPGWRLII